MKQYQHHSNQPSLMYDAEKTKTAYHRLRTLSSSLRVEIVNYMSRRESKVASKDIAEHFHLNPSEAQKHLDVLSSANYLTTEHSGDDCATYRPNRQRISVIARMVKGLVG